MTRFSDPIVVEHDFEVLKYFWHTINGLYIWEFLTTLDFELDVIRRRRPYRWTIWIYSLTRLSTLMTVILNVILNLTFDTTTVIPINCQAFITSQLTFAYLGLVTASLLIIFRITAIWDKNKLVVGTAIIVWATNVSAMILGIVRIRSAWVSVLQDCVVLNTEKSKPSIIITLITDIVLLLIVLIGLLRLHDSGGSFALGRLLWKQGVIWLLIATVAGVPPMAFIILNLNASLNLMFQLPSAIAMSIAATRIHRNLAHFVYGSRDTSLDGLQICDGKITKTPSAPTPVSQIEVTVEVLCERHSSTAQSIVSIDGQLGYKPQRSSFDGDLERALENPVPR
ncbi:hypothetical protein BGY98DRAFT_549610 [Russula aff. rugulosa BPL654]|nr:hypothetical protein BGY98DRAFT_549610 [Russula aff. rugulosa BPL654]